jgi:hypothetical protein
MNKINDWMFQNDCGDYFLVCQFCGKHKKINNPESKDGRRLIAKYKNQKYFCTFRSLKCKTRSSIHRLNRGEETDILWGYAEDDVIFIKETCRKCGCVRFIHSRKSVKEALRRINRGHPYKCGHCAKVENGHLTASANITKYNKSEKHRKKPRRLFLIG